MSQDATSEGDLRNTGMSLKHDREWDYELEQIVEAIEERDAKRVGLQFPEGLKRRGPAVADDLRQLCDDDVTFMLSGQPCYGACDLDTYLMRRTDVFVHFGHSPMKESDKIIYVPLFSNVDPFPIMEDALDDIEGDEVGLVTTAQHMNRFEDMCDWLEERGYTVQTRKGDDRLTYEGQVLGCNYAPRTSRPTTCSTSAAASSTRSASRWNTPTRTSSSPTPSTTSSPSRTRGSS